MPIQELVEREGPTARHILHGVADGRPMPLGEPHPQLGDVGCQPSGGLFDTHRPLSMTLVGK